MGYFVSMMLSTARRFVTAARPVVPRTLSGSTHGFATVSSPRPLSFRMDGLFAKCMVAAVVYFAPQDIIIIGGLLAFWHKQGTTAAPKAVQNDAESALEEFKSKKGLDKLNVSKSRSTWYCALKVSA